MMHPDQDSNRPYDVRATEARVGAGLGHRTWAIAEGYIPGRSRGPEDMRSHETICILNTSDEDADLELTVYFSDREPAGPYHLHVPARRTSHQWLNALEDPEPIPTDTDYAMVLRASVPVVVQHTRLDSREPAGALLSTVAFPFSG
jgi:hypothetical protein